MKTKTIEQIKNEVALKHGYSTWCDVIKILIHYSWRYNEFLEIEKEAMQAYAKQMCEEQRKHHAFKIMSECKSTLIGDSLYRDIMNLPLATDNI